MGGKGADSIVFHIEDDNVDLDLRLATFTNWRADDHVTIVTTASNCTIHGTDRADEVRFASASVFNELNGTPEYNLIEGHGGNDSFIYDGSAPLFSTIDGGAGWDSIVDVGGGSPAWGIWLINIEEMRFEHSASVSAPLFGATFSTAAFDVGMTRPSLHFVDAVIDSIHLQFEMWDDPHFSAKRFTFENWEAGNTLSIFGFAAADTIAGSAVDDGILGQDGDDRLSGGLGNDILAGGAGADILIGGAGNDSFYFFAGDSGALPNTRDRILDFNAGDKIDLSSIDASTTFAGDQAFVLDTDGILTEGEIQLRGNLHTLIRINLDADSDADMEIVLRGVALATLSEADFVL